MSALPAATPAALRRAFRDFERRYPRAWAEYARFLDSRAAGDFDWPDWCYCPLAGAYAVTDGRDVALAGALGAWRARPLVFQPVSDQGIGDRIDLAAITTGLPRWCTWMEAAVPFLVHLERDANDGRTDLRMVLELAPGTWAGVPVHLDAPTWERGIDLAVAEVALRGGRDPRVADVWRALLAQLLPAVGELLRQPANAVAL